MASICDINNDNSPLIDLRTADGDTQKSFIQFRRRWIKWLGLFLICLYPFGKNWAYDNPQPLESVLVPTMNISYEEYNLFYTLYSVPNYIMPLFSGYLIDRYGTKFGVIVFGALLAIGQLLFCIGCATSTYAIALAGRLVFGLGAETSLMLKFFMLAAWFKNKEFGFASGMTFVSERFGSTLNSILTPKIYQASQSLGLTTGVGFACCLVSQVSGLIWLVLDAKYVRRKGDNKRKASRPEFKQILKFKPFTFLYAVLAMLMIGVLGSFSANGNAFLQQQYQFTQTEAGNIFSIMYVIAAIATPVFGKIVDMIGHKIHFLILALMLLATTMFLFRYLPECYQCGIAFIPLVCLGLSNAIFTSSYWPSMVLLEKREYFGLVNGFIHCSYNISIGIYPLVIGRIQDSASKNDVYHYILILEAISACVGIVVALMLEFMNIRNHKGLNKKIDSRTDLH